MCAAGNEEACKKVKFTEVGNFLGSLGGGAAAGYLLTVPVVGTICVALGVPTGGAATLACGILVVGTGSFAGGELGAKGGEAIGEVIYESLK